MRKGEQDLIPTDKNNFDIVPYREHYYYVANVNKYKVRLDGKLTRHMHLSLQKIEKLVHDFTHIIYVKDQYYITAGDNKVYFMEFNEEDNSLNQIEGIEPLGTDSSEAEVLSKSMTTKLLKEEISTFETFGILKKEVILGLEVARDQLSTDDKAYFLMVVSNVKIYVYHIKFPNNTFLSHPF